MMNVLAALMPAATPEPPQLKDIVPPQPYFIPANYLWLAGGIIALLAAAYLAWRCFRRFIAKPPPRPNPRQAAAARLRELLRRAPEMDARLFGTEVCDVLRVFIGEQYRLHPERQTSAEFLASIAGSTHFTPRDHALLAAFLEQCDLLKFARHDAALPAKERLIEQATEFVEGSAVFAATFPAPVTLSKA
jgi:hypothetical protein